MEGQVSEYKCPACTGPLRYDGATGQLQCDYCGSSYSVAEIEKMFASQDAAAAAQANAPADEWETTAQEWNEKGMKSYTCPSCGAELILDATTAATECPYCGNTTMVPGQFSGTLKPEYVIPFKLDKDHAVDNLKNYYKGKFLLPKAFKAGNRIEEIQGVYVPFWLYDGKAHAKGRYDARNVKTYTRGNYRVTETDYYEAEREGDIAFEKIPADASSKMPDDLMDSIEPYDYKELTEFSSAYLAGFVADKYDVTAEENAPRATERAKQSALDALKADVKGYDEVYTEAADASVRQGKVSYAMFPVWMLNTKWNNKNYLFAMNGQTGRFVGALPMDKVKAVLSFIAVMAIMEVLTGLYTAVFDSQPDGFSIFLRFILIPIAVAVIVFFILKAQLNNVAKAQTASAYVTDGGMTFTHRADHFIRHEEVEEEIEHDEPDDK